MDLKVSCTCCNCEVTHTCDGDAIEALKKLLRWVPYGVATKELDKALREQPEHCYGQSDEDRNSPFFGSQGWSFALFGKEDARTFHAMVHNLIRAHGLDPYAFERQLAEEKKS